MKKTTKTKPISGDEPRRCRLVGYIRVSTDHQVKDGYSLPAQERKLQAYAATHGYELVDIITDDESAKDMDRAALRAALMMLRIGEADGLLVAKLDRLTRHVGDIGALVEQYFSESAGKSLHSVHDHVDTTTAGGRMVLNMLTTIAQWEREAIAERVKDGLREAMRQGAVPGSMPYGSTRTADVDAKGRRCIVTDERDAPALYVVRTLHEAGWTVRAIAAELDRQGIATKRSRRIVSSRGWRWHPTQVQRIITNLEVAA